MSVPKLGGHSGPRSYVGYTPNRTDLALHTHTHIYIHIYRRSLYSCLSLALNHTQSPSRRMVLSLPGMHIHLSESHCTVVKMVGVQDKLLRSPLSIAKSPCTSRSLGEVASSSGGQQAREQKRSAGRQLGGGDDGFD